MSGATFREFTQQVQYAYGRLTHDCHERDPTPMLIFDTPGGIRMIAIEPGFFDPERPDRLDWLVRHFILPAIPEWEATKVAWAYPAHKIEQLHSRFKVNPPDAIGVSEEVVIAVIVDREVHEMHYARRLTHEATQELAEWTTWPAGAPETPAIHAVKEALR